jgi:PAS domain S-box-containing protein
LSTDTGSGIYRKILEELPAPIFLKRLDGSYIYGNESFCNLIGRTTQQLVGSHDRDLFDEDDVKQLAESEASAAAGIFYSPKTITLRIEGTVSTYLILRTPLQDTTGVFGLAGIMLNYTKPSQQLQSQINFVNRLKTVLENLPEQIVVVNRQGRLRYMNQKYSSQHANQLIGSNTFMDSCRAHTNEVKAAIEKVCTTLTEERLQFNTASKSQELILVPINVKGDQAAELVLISIRNTEDLTIKTSKTPVIIQDCEKCNNVGFDLSWNLGSLAGCGTWRIDKTTDEVMWSSMLHSIVGSSPTSFTPTATSLTDIMFSEDEKRYNSLLHLQDKSRHRDPFEFEGRITNLNGDIREIRVFCKLTKNTQQHTLEGAVLDITSYKQYHQQKIENLKRQIEESERKIQEYALEVQRKGEAVQLGMRRSSSPEERARITSGIINLANTMYPVELETNGLYKACWSLITNSETMQPDITFRFVSDLRSDERLDKQVEVAAFRVLQTALDMFVFNKGTKSVSGSMIRDTERLHINVVAVTSGMDSRSDAVKNYSRLMERLVESADGRVIVSNTPAGPVQVAVSIPL